MGIKEFLLRKSMERQMKDMPEGQRNMFMDMVKKNPEFFQKLQDEIKACVKKGQNKTIASISVMKKHQNEIQNMMKG